MGPLRAPSRTYQISFIPSCISRLPPVNCLSFRNRSDVTFEYVVLRALFTVPISPRRAVFVSETRTMDLRFPRILDRCLTPPFLSVAAGRFLIEGGGAVPPSLQARCEESRAACFFALASRNVSATDQGVTLSPAPPRRARPVPCSGLPRAVPSLGEEDVKDQTGGQIVQCNLFAVRELEYVPIWLS